VKPRATVALAFAAAAAAKIARPRRWRRALTAYAMGRAAQRMAAVAVPALELALAALAPLGLRRIAGLASVVVLAAFSFGIVLARARSGDRLACGCFGTPGARDYRLLLARNAVLTVAALAAATWARDAWIGPATLRSSDGVPFALVLVGTALVGWVAARARLELRRGAGT